ncbi:virulence factor family protein [Stigmatella aurantiaca]|uniref:Virulence factor family protein n=2 Tax=Stigmatella aurantiaca (strain DW4/3-1) TaxID=378806 RepID=E3FET3_STIAD|nr:AcvB/VirJ family lysyl-phosphatidylglycerol hydrolase [Stigmatella aurantiaca]ADO68914.1 virulence factor family protein [Stigmatella aurantiaca DW4/3-1]
MKTFWLVLSLLLALGGSASEAMEKSSLSFGRFGRVEVLRPSDAPRGVALLLTGPDASGPLAKALASRGALVLSIDTTVFLKRLAQGQGCAYPAGDLEALSQFSQKELGLPEYLHPVLIGSQGGAALAYAALAQSPENTFRGVVTLGFDAELPLAIPLCRGNGLARARTRGGVLERVKPVSALNAPWRLMVDGQGKGQGLAEARAFTQQMQGAQVIAPPEGTWPPEARLGTLLQFYEDLSQPRPPPTPSAAPPAKLESVSGLPLIELPTPPGPADTLALLLSGDGGWAGIDKHLAEALNAQGLPVLGWDSLRYFWKRRTPEETARDVERALTHYLDTWGKQKVVLVGYSRGADLLPAITARLSPALRERVILVALVAPGKGAEFEVHITDLLGGGGNDAAVLPEVEALEGKPVLCLYGDAEAAESLCPLLTKVPGAKTLMLKGGHHFDGDYARVARAIIAALAPEGAP